MQLEYPVQHWLKTSPEVRRSSMRSRSGSDREDKRLSRLGETIGRDDLQGERGGIIDGVDFGQKEAGRVFKRSRCV